MKTSKVYIASSVELSRFIPYGHPHRGNNGNAQFAILIRSTSIKRVAEIVGTTVGQLREFNGIHALREGDARREIASNFESIYYAPEHTSIGYVRGWVEIPRRDNEVFGEGVWVYCNQHLCPHLTGWCSVWPKDKIKLEATSEREAFAECRSKGFILQ